MPYKQTKDLLEQIRDFNDELRAYLQSLSDQSKDDRIKLLLDYESKQKQNFEQSLAEFEEKASKTVLDTWFQFTPDQPLGEILNSMRSRKMESVDDVIGLTIKFNDTLIGFFKQLEEMAQNQEVKEIFQRMIEMHEKGKSEFSTGVNLLRDI